MELKTKQMRKMLEPIQQHVSELVFRDTSLIIDIPFKVDCEELMVRQHGIAMSLLNNIVAVIK